MKTHWMRLAVIVTVLSLVAGCGSATPAQPSPSPPASTAVPPTAAPPATVTPVPPTSTPPPPPSPTVAPTVQPTPSPQPTPPSAQLIREEITSQALAGNLLGDPAERAVYVILPPGYETSGKRYPVVYVMPWAESIPSENASMFYATMALLPRGEINDMIVVVPDGTSKLGASLFRSSPAIGDYETYVSQELVNYVDTHYRTLPARESRGLAGCSSGGSASMRLGLKYPNIFSVVAATDGSYDDSLEAWPSDVETVQHLKELPGDIMHLRANDMLAWYVQAAAGTAPDPNNPPFYCEMPVRIVDGRGEFVPEVIAKIVDADSAHEARRYVRQPVRLQGILIRHGSLDTDYSQSVLGFEKLLTDLGIEHQYVEEKTGHCGDGWEEASLKYMSDKLAFGEE
jgi:enterochelin esterase-like enzyme